ncbi:MAG: Ig-like domain-containing protein, partial [Microcoleaceae cyanobacterium]
SGSWNGETVALENFRVNSIDIDGSGLEFVEYGGFSSFEVAQNTVLVLEAGGGDRIRFTGNGNYNGLIVNEIGRVQTEFETAVNSFEITMGLTGVSNSARLFGSNFATIGFNNSTEEFVSPTVETQTTTDRTPTLAGTIGTQALAVEETVTVTVNGITYTDGDGNLTVTGTNWTLNIPDTNTLTPNVYEVVVSRIYDGDNYTFSNSDLTFVDASTEELTVINQSPIADDETFTIDEDSAPVTIDLLDGDTDLDGDTLSVKSINGTELTGEEQDIPVENGTVNVAPDGTVTFTPDPEYNGPVNFEYVVQDGNGGEDTGAVTGTVEPINDPPVAVNDTAVVAENNSVNIPVLDNDDFGTDGPGTITIDEVTNGTAVVNNNGTADDPTDDTIDFTPDPDYSGPATINYTITDSNGDTSSAVVDVTVNDQPTAVDDTATVEADSSVNIPILDNDDFGTDGPGTITIDEVTNGTATVNNNGTADDPTDDTIDFTPDPDYSGPATINYTITDADGDTSSAVVDVTVNAENLPTAVNDTATVEPENSVSIPVLENDDFGTDGPGTITIDEVTNGTAVLNDGGTPDDPTDDTIDFTPDADYNGPATINYTITDADGDTSSAVVDVTVNALDPENNPPTVDSGEITVTENESDTPLGLNPPVDPEGDELTITVTEIPELGTVTKADGTPLEIGDELTPEELEELLYDAPPEYNGEEPGNFGYTVNDGTNIVPGTVEITITPDQDPIANDDNGSTFIDQPVSINITDNDTDIDGSIDPSTVDLDPNTDGIQKTLEVPEQGNFEVDELGNVTFTPEPGFVGEVSIPYTVKDNNNQISEPANISVEVVNIPPVANDDSASSEVDVPVTFNVVNNDTDEDGSIDTFHSRPRPQY